FAFQCKMYLGHVKVLLGMFLSLKTLYRKRTVIWPFYFYTIIRTLSMAQQFEVVCNGLNENEGQAIQTMDQSASLIRSNLIQVKEQLEKLAVY
ncbi:hypothetical protein, partial [Staphylococcus aureus]